MFKIRVVPFIFVIVLFSCVKKNNDKFTDTYTVGTIPIATDVSFEPIINEEITVFQALSVEAHVKPIYTDEKTVIDLLMKDSVRLAVVARQLTEKEIKFLRDKSFEPHCYKIATDGIALVVNNANPDSVISLNDIRRILTGKVNGWNEIYPKSRLGKFMVVFDNTNSSTVRYATDSICRGQQLTKEAYAQTTNEEVIKFVSKTKNAIGVLAVNWLKNAKDSTNLSFNKAVRVMSVSNQEIATPDNSYQPFQAYLLDGSYPLSRSIYIVLNDPRGSLPSNFCHFVTGDKGQRIILKAGLVPETQPLRLVNVTNENN